MKNKRYEIEQLRKQAEELTSESAVQPVVIRDEIVKFFDEMVNEFEGGIDNGVDPFIDKYVVDNGLRPFMQSYIKRFDVR